MIEKTLNELREKTQSNSDNIIEFNTSVKYILENIKRIGDLTEDIREWQNAHGTSVVHQGKSINSLKDKISTLRDDLTKLESKYQTDKIRIENKIVNDIDIVKDELVDQIRTLKEIVENHTSWISDQKEEQKKSKDDIRSLKNSIIRWIIIGALTLIASALGAYFGLSPKG